MFLTVHGGMAIFRGGGFVSGDGDIAFFCASTQTQAGD